MKHTEEQYNKLLRKFVDSSRIDWLRTSFMVGEKSASSNAYQLIATPLQIDAEDLSVKTSRVYPFRDDTEFAHTLQYDFLKQEISKVPLVDDYEEIECKACDGEGEVEYTFEYQQEEYTKEHNCPICKGDGYKQGAYIGKVPDASARIKIGIQYFYAKYIADIFFVCETLGVTEIKIAKQISSTEPLMLQISDCDFLVMPFIYDGEKIISEIKLD